MKRNFFKGAALAAIALVGFTATAQEEESKGIELTGSVDSYFRTNINGRNGANASAPETSFVDRDGFSVGMINLIASKQIGKVGFVADLVYGPRGAAAVDGVGSENIVNQAFLTYAASDAVTLTLGRFNTFLGYEVISPSGNFNYSTSYMFSNGPFSHNGIKADIALDDNWSLMGAIMNQTDVTFGNANGKYTAGLQLGYSNDKGSVYLNATYGRNSVTIGVEDLLDAADDAGVSDEVFDAISEAGDQTVTAEDDTFQIDITTGWDLSDEFYLGANATIQDTDGEGFAGIALYPQYAFSDDFSLGLRGEFFQVISDNEASEVNFTAVTLTGSYSVGALTIKPELRLDSSDVDQATFADADGDAQKSLASFVLGAIYSF